MSTTSDLPPVAIYRPRKRLKASVAARLIGEPTSKFFRWLEEGRIPSWKIGGSRYVLKSDLRRLAQAVPPKTPRPRRPGLATANSNEAWAQRELARRGVPIQR